MANLTCEVFQTLAGPPLRLPLPRAAFGLSLFARWRTRGKGLSPMIGLAIGRSDSRMGEASNQSEGSLVFGARREFEFVAEICPWTMPMHGDLYFK